MDDENTLPTSISTSAVNLDDLGEKPLTSDAAPSTSAGTRKHEDMHDVPHPHFRWHADVLVDGHDMYQGIVKDISIKGLSLLLDHNLQNAKLIKLHIHVPPLDVTSPPHIMEIAGKINSTVYDGSELSFRSGITLLKFTLNSDQALLQSRIANR